MSWKSDSSPPEAVTRHNNLIALAGERYRRAATEFNKRKCEGAGAVEQKQLLESLHVAANEFFNIVENAIVECEVLSQNEFWATDLADTASNVLDSIPRHFEKLRSECERLKAQAPRPSPNAYTAMQSAVSRFNPDQAQSLKSHFMKSNLPTRGFEKPRTLSRADMSVGVVAACSFVIMLLVGVFFDAYNPQNFFIFRTLMALSAATCAGAFIPGALEVKTTAGRKHFIRATGALAVFLMVYFLNPPPLPKESSVPIAPGEVQP